MKCPHLLLPPLLLLWISAAQLLRARMRSLRVRKKWMMCMYVPVCAKRLCLCVCVCVCVCVCQSSRQRGGGGGVGGRRRRKGVKVCVWGGRRLTVRPSLSLVCPSSAVPFRHVPRRFFFFFFFFWCCSPVPPPSPPLPPPSPPPPIDAIKAGFFSFLFFSDRAAPESSRQRRHHPLPLALDRLVVTQT